MQFLEYGQKVIQNSLREKIPNWDTLSPMDPMKVFTEGVLASLVEVEKLSLERTHRLLSLLPAFCGYHPRQAMAPVGLFELVPSEILKSTWSLPKGSSFQYRLDSMIWDIYTTEPTAVLPIRIESANTESSLFELGIEILYPCSQLTLHFVPFPSSDLQPTLMSGIPSFELKRWNSEENRIESIPPNTYRITYSGPDWSRSLKIQIEPNRKNLFLFRQKGDRFQLNWTFPEQQQPKGRFYTNLVSGQIVRTHDSVELGKLKGLPWEELPLNPEVIEVPEKLNLRFPNGNDFTLTQIKNEILQAYFEDPGKLKNTFIYDAAHHSVIFPSAFQLTHQYQGGVTVTLPSHSQFPKVEWMPPEAKLSFSGFSGMIDSIRPIQLESPQIPHEHQSDYLARFYSSWKAFLTRDNPVFLNTLPWKEIELELLGQSPRIQFIELIADDQNKRVDIFVMDQTGIESVNRSLDPLIHSLLDQTLKKRLPLSFSWKIQTFKKLPLLVRLRVDVSCTPDRYFRLDQDEVQNWIHSQKTSIFHPQVMKDEMTREELEFKYLELVQNCPEKEEYPLKDEVAQIKLWAFSQNDKLLLPAFSRRLGECYYPVHELKLNFLAEEDETA